ncbi:hypothetical protein FUMI01_12910 [Flavobacterium sp. UMI-01]|nr:hypothetical protein FUMI01_12910 [Flavobacterium sp. UMI-01]
MENFTLSNRQVTWNKVFETPKTKEIIKTEIENRNNLKITSITDNSIIGEFSNLIMDYKKAGFSYMGTPIILNETNKFSGSFKIEFKENRYRATIWNLSSKGMSTTFYGGGLGLGSEITTSLEQLLLKNNREEFRKNAYKVNGKIIDTTFITLMDYTVEAIKNDKW